MWCHVVQYVCRLGHLHHKGRFSLCYVVACPHPGEYLIHNAYAGALCRHKTTQLCHQCDESRLPEQCRFSRHIGSCDDHYLLLFGIQQYVVGHIGLSWGQLGFNHGMPALPDVYHTRFVYLWLHVVMLLCRLGKRDETVHLCHQIGVDFYLRYILLHGSNQVVEQTCFQQQYLVFSSQYLLLILLEFFGDIAFCLCQCLLAYPCIGHLVFKGVAHLQVIAKHVVVAYLQA